MKKFIELNCENSKMVLDSELISKVELIHSPDGFILTVESDTGIIHQGVGDSAKPEYDEIVKQLCDRKEATEPLYLICAGYSLQRRMLEVGDTIPAVLFTTKDEHELKAVLSEFEDRGDIVVVYAVESREIEL